MKSEKSIGRALTRLIKDGITSRDEVFICTKNGYITNDGDYPGVDVMEYMQNMFVSTGLIDLNDISSGYNVLNPNYIARCIDKSLMNMHLSTIDLGGTYTMPLRVGIMMLAVYNLWKCFQKYLKFMKNTANKKIRYYGMATWTCFRVPPNNNEYLSLEEVVNLAEKVGGMDNMDLGLFNFLTTYLIVRHCY